MHSLDEPLDLKLSITKLRAAREKRERTLSAARHRALHRELGLADDSPTPGSPGSPPSGTACLGQSSDLGALVIGKMSPDGLTWMQPQPLTASLRVPPTPTLSTHPPSSSSLHVHHCPWEEGTDQPSSRSWLSRASTDRPVGGFGGALRGSRECTGSDGRPCGPVSGLWGGVVGQPGRRGIKPSGCFSGWGGYLKLRSSTPFLNVDPENQIYHI